MVSVLRYFFLVYNSITDVNSLSNSQRGKQSMCYDVELISVDMDSVILLYDIGVYVVF